jgi:hypothetical protein
VRNRGADKKPLDALRELDRLGGRGHLQDIRQGAFGTKYVARSAATKPTNELGADGKEMSQRERSAWIKPVIVTVFVGLILSATVAAKYGLVPLTPRNDIVRSLQR